MLKEKGLESAVKWHIKNDILVVELMYKDRVKHDYDSHLPIRGPQAIVLNVKLL